MSDNIRTISGQKLLLCYSSVRRRSHVLIQTVLVQSFDTLTEFLQLVFYSDKRKIASSVFIYC
jgi:hypothetical protein